MLGTSGSTAGGARWDVADVISEACFGAGVELESFVGLLSLSRLQVSSFDNFLHVFRALQIFAFRVSGNQPGKLLRLLYEFTVLYDRKAVKQPKRFIQQFAQSARS